MVGELGDLPCGDFFGFYALRLPCLEEGLVLRSSRIYFLGTLRTLILRLLLLLLALDLSLRDEWDLLES